MRTTALLSIAIAGLCTAIVSASSLAQPAAGNPQRGREFAARLCITCHVIDRTTTGPVRADVPSFPAIARRSGSTAEYLAGKIIVPHPAMPGIALTADEVPRHCGLYCLPEAERLRYMPQVRCPRRTMIPIALEGGLRLG
jgi:mono/diheme cytochrome c family protein